MTNLDFCHIWLYEFSRGDILKEYKRCLGLIRTYLKDENLNLDDKKLDSLISEELDKPQKEMDTRLIDLCLNALVAYRVYMSERENKH